MPFFNALEVARADVASFNTLAGTNDNIYEYMGASLSQMANFPSTTQLGTLPRCLLPGLATIASAMFSTVTPSFTKTWFEVNPNWAWVLLSAAAGYLPRRMSLVWHSWYNTQVARLSHSHCRTATAKFGTTPELDFP